MKKRAIYILCAVLFGVCLSTVWAFKSTPDQPESYACVNLYGGINRYAVYAYSEVLSEEAKFDKGLSDPQVIVQITSKMVAKGYTLDHYSASPPAGAVSLYSFIFKKKP